MESLERMRDDRVAAGKLFSQAAAGRLLVSTGPRCSIGQHLLNTGARYCLPYTWPGRLGNFSRLARDSFPHPPGADRCEGLPGPFLGGHYLLHPGNMKKEGESHGPR